MSSLKAALARASVSAVALMGVASGAWGLTFSDPEPSSSGLWDKVVDPDHPAAGLYVLNTGNSVQWYTASTYLISGFPHVETAGVYWGIGSRYTAGSVNPAVDGAIESIDFSISTKKGSYDGVDVAFMLMQNGKYYRTDFFTQPPGLSAPLEVFSGTGLNAASFGEFVGKAYQYSNPTADGRADFNSNPDFTASGGTIQFGYLAHFQSDLSSGASGTAYQMTRAWSTTINFGVPITGWAYNRSGDWNDASNWVGTTPNAIDAVATLGNVLAANQTIYSNIQVRVGTIKFDSPFQYNLGGAGSLGIDVSTGSGSIQVVRGDQKINLPLFLHDNTTADVAAGATLTIADPMTLVAGSTLSKTGAGDLVIEAPVRNAGAAAMVVSGGTARLNYPVGTAASASAAASTALDVSVTGSRLVLGANQVLRGLSAATANAGDQEIDLAGYSAQIYSANASAAEQGIYNAIKNARLSASGKDGIYDSTIASSNYAVGVTDQAIDAHGDHLVVVKKTILGDTNVDGHVDVIDLGILATSWQTSGLWDNGDSNFDGFIDVIDLGMLATNWQQSAGGPSLGEALAAYGLPSVSVPEPASIGLVGLLGGLMLSRKRRNG